MPSVLMASMFFPRGGSAMVMRALARRLPREGWDTTVLAGSLPGHGDAREFYSATAVHPVVFAPHGATPLHPSYEGPRAFAALDDDEFELHVEAWSAHLEDAGAAEADVLHLNHLTPVNEAAARVAPGTPVVGHLHGTELLMLERMRDAPPPSWEHAAAWARRMRAWAHRCELLIVPARVQLPRVERLLGVSRDRCVVLPNGVDLALFDRMEVDRHAHWRTELCEQPRGWLPGGEEGSIAYPADAAERVAQGTVVLYVGRFTEVKRLPLLIEAWAQARPPGASLVLVGGHPGEWEGEHPAETIERTGAQGVHLAGWRAQERLPAFLAAADVLVMPSVREQFGMVITEAMACGVPPIAIDAYGPRDIVRDGETGWLVAPDDRDALAAAIAHAVGDAEERRRRGEAAHEDARRRFGWDAIARRLAGTLERARSGRSLVA